MKYYGTYSCGHSGEIDIIGPTKDRGWKQEREFEKLCPECRALRRKKMNDEENKKAMDASIEKGLPILSGSEKQIAWATTIRYKFVDMILSNPNTVVMVGYAYVLTEQWKKAFNSIVAEETAASFWINNRNVSKMYECIWEKWKNIYPDYFEKYVKQK